jgi:hypothetical protein
MFSIIIFACLELILRDPIGHPSLVIFTPYLPLNFWVISTIAICGLSIKVIITHGHTLLLLFYYVLDKTIVLIRT